MSTKRDTARRKAASLTLFLAILAGTGWALSPAIDESSSMSFTVNLKEWFVLEVQTPESKIESSDARGATVTTMMSLGGIPARIKALTAVSQSQVVELRAQVFGDLVGPSGETLGLSEVSWEGTGDGFLNGRLAPTGSAVLARWMGPGFHEGSIKYFSPQIDSKNYSQRVVYSLSSI